jgi:hypothetical protein
MVVVGYANGHCGILYLKESILVKNTSSIYLWVFGTTYAIHGSQRGIEYR